MLNCVEDEKSFITLGPDYLFEPAHGVFILITLWSNEGSGDCEPALIHRLA